MDIRRPTDLKAVTEARRLELGKKWKDVLAETGLSYQTLNIWRKGHKVDPLTDRKISRALLWAPGSRDSVMAGGEPTLLDVPPRRRQSARPERLDDPTADAIDAILSRFSPDQQSEIMRRVLQRYPEEQREDIWMRLTGEDADGPPAGEQDAG